MKKPAEILAAIALSLSLGVVHADVVEYDIYMTDSNAGRTVFERRDGEVSGNQQLAFNNRRSNIDMTFVLGENQVPSRMAFKGTSPFGAPVDEEFNFENGTSRWASTDEHGSVETPQPLFYIPNVQSPVVYSLLVRALLADDDHAIDVLPQGQVRLEELDRMTIEEGERRETVHLYALSGLGFTPDLAWYDGNGDMFASDESGYFSIWRAGWDRTKRRELKRRQIKAADTYLRQLANKHTHTSSAPILLGDVNLVDVEAGKLLEIG